MAKLPKIGLICKILNILMIKFMQIVVFVSSEEYLVVFLGCSR